MTLPPFTFSLIRNHRTALETVVGKEQADLLSDEEIYDTVNLVVPLATGKEEDAAILEELEELVRKKKESPSAAPG